MLVCKQWHICVNETPQLWTKIAIPSGSSAVVAPTRHSMKHWLRKAGVLLLDVKIALMGCRRSIINRLIVHASRFRSLNLTIGSTFEDTWAFTGGLRRRERWASDLLAQWDRLHNALQGSIVLRSLSVQIPETPSDAQPLRWSRLVLPSVEYLSLENPIDTTMFTCPSVKTLVILSPRFQAGDWMVRLPEEYTNTEQLRIGHGSFVSPGVQSTFKPGSPPVVFPKLIGLWSDYDVGRIMDGSRNIRRVTIDVDRLWSLKEGFIGVATNCRTLVLRLPRSQHGYHTPSEPIEGSQYFGLFQSFVALKTLVFDLSGKKQPDSQYLLPILNYLSASHNGKVIFPELTTVVILERGAEKEWPLLSYRQTKAVQRFLAYRDQPGLPDPHDTRIWISSRSPGWTFKEAWGVLGILSNLLEKDETTKREIGARADLKVR
jgi:hypothetical protein